MRTEVASAGSHDWHAWWKTALLLFVFGTVTSTLFAFVYCPHQRLIETYIDLNGFGQLGRHIAWGDGFSLGYGPTLRRAPLYPALIGLSLKLCGNNRPEIPDAVAYRPVLILQCLMIGLTCVVSGSIARKLFGDRTGLCAGIVCGVMPQSLRYVGMTEVETSMGLLIALMTLTSLNLYRQATLRNGALFGLTSATATLVKPIAMLYPVVFALFALWQHRGADATWRRNSFVALSAMFSVMLACMLPWMIRNRIVSYGRYNMISSNAPGEFLRGYVNAQPKFVLLKQDFGGSDPTRMQWDGEANLYEQALLQKYGISFFSRERFGPHGERMPMESRIDLEIAKDKAESQEVRLKILHEPIGVARKFVTQMFTFWYIVETRQKSKLVGFIALGVLFLAAFGCLRARRFDIDVTPVIAIILYFQILYALILAFARYSMPLFPTLIVLAAFGLVQLIGMDRKVQDPHHDTPQSPLVQLTDMDR